MLTVECDTTAKGEGIPESFSTVPSDKNNHNCYSRNDLMNALSKLQNNLTKVENKKNIVKINAEHIKRAIMADMGFGFDCSSVAELVLARRVGGSGRSSPGSSRRNAGYREP